MAAAVIVIPSFSFLLHPVHHRFPFVNLAYFMGNAGIEKNPFGKGRLARIYVGNNSYISCFFYRIFSPCCDLKSKNIELDFNTTSNLYKNQEKNAIYKYHVDRSKTKLASLEKINLYDKNSLPKSPTVLSLPKVYES